MIYGYARVSTTCQGRDGNSLEDQRRALQAYGCQEIIEEAITKVPPTVSIEDIKKAEKIRDQFQGKNNERKRIGFM